MTNLCNQVNQVNHVNKVVFDKLDVNYVLILSLTLIIT